MRGLRLGMGMSWRGGGESGFSPLSLSPSAWWDASDLTRMFTTSAGSTNVAAAADPIGRVEDKSGAARNLLQATAGLRPAYRTTSGKGAINPDGADDVLATAAGQTWPASLDVFIVMSNTEADASYTLLDNGGAFLGCAISGAGGTVAALTGSNPPCYVNNSAAISDRGALHTSIGTTAVKVVEFRAIVVGTDFATMATGLSAGAPFGGRYHEILIYPELSAGDRTTVRDYLTTKWGAA